MSLTSVYPAPPLVPFSSAGAYLITVSVAKAFFTLSQPNLCPCVDIWLAAPTEPLDAAFGTYDRAHWSRCSRGSCNATHLPFLASVEPLSIQAARKVGWANHRRAILRDPSCSWAGPAILRGSSCSWVGPDRRMRLLFRCVSVAR